ncbi:MAG: hypothetical protein C3F11_16430 [Methylocystaceae bacterium]|nr:MAG: hypothetical protein C3F11_16430 [Methylocystaceae bacterium]
MDARTRKRERGTAVNGFIVENLCFEKIGRRELAGRFAAQSSSFQALRSGDLETRRNEINRAEPSRIPGRVFARRE